MRRYRVAMVACCPFPANHGSPASVREMSQALARLGHEVHVVCYPFGQDIAVEGITIHRAPDPFGNRQVTVGPTWHRPWLDLGLAAKLCQVVRREEIDLIHAHNYEGALAGMVARLLTRRPLLYNGVNTMIDELPNYDFIRPRALAVALARFLDHTVPRGADFVTAVSEELRDFLVQRGIDRDKIEVVPAGVEPEMFAHGDGGRIRRRHGLEGVPVVMYTGTLDPFQRLDYLLKAMTVVAAAAPQARLLVVANIVVERYRESYQAMARELGIGDRVLFLGPVDLDEIPDYLAAADVAVVPRPECPGHPVKLLNYMAAGKPIASFAGSAKGIRHGDNGLIAANHDWPALGEAVLRLVREPELALRLGDSARRYLHGRYDWDSLARRISAIYDQLRSSPLARAADKRSEV